MHSTSRMWRGVVAGFMVTLAACVDSPNEPQAIVDDIPLATSFDELSAEATQQGDAGRAEEFGWAALAVRAGMAPSLLEVRSGGKVEVYNAFVHGVSVSATLPSGAMNFATQTLIAWLRGAEKLQVLMIGGPAGVTQVVHPVSAGAMANLPVGPRARGHAAYFERGPEPSSWVGTSGAMKLQQESAGAECEPRRPNLSQSLTTCQQAEFRAAFDLIFTKTRPDTRRVDANPPTRRFVANEQRVKGIKLTINCQPGNASRPCS